MIIGVGGCASGGAVRREGAQHQGPRDIPGGWVNRSQEGGRVHSIKAPETSPETALM